MHAHSITRRRLPHWDVPNAAYFVTTCLAGSIPAEGLLDLERYRCELQTNPLPPGKSEFELRRRIDKLVFARRDSWLDRKPAVRHLEDPRLARIVVDALYHFAGQRYDLLAYVVMPSHLHWLFQPLAAWVETLESVAHVPVGHVPVGHVSNVPDRSPRQRIQHSLNRFTAQRCNEILATTGPFWQRESYDHWVRDADELERIIRYIEDNPVKAGLVSVPEEWQFSSAHDRRSTRTEPGLPLLRR